MMSYNKIHPEIQRIRCVQVRATSKPFRAEGHPTRRKKKGGYLQVPAKILGERTLHRVQPY